MRMFVALLCVLLCASFACEKIHKIESVERYWPVVGGPLSNQRITLLMSESFCCSAHRFNGECPVVSKLSIGLCSCIAWSCASFIC